MKSVHSSWLKIVTDRIRHRYQNADNFAIHCAIDWRSVYAFVDGNTLEEDVFEHICFLLNLNPQEIGNQGLIASNP